MSQNQNQAVLHLDYLTDFPHSLPDTRKKRRRKKEEKKKRKKEEREKAG